VRPAAELLRERVRRHLFISAVMVYGDPVDRPVLESHPRVAAAGEDVTEVDGQTYGRLKVACEDIVQDIYADRCTILRPQIVAGPHDPSGRYTWWVRRAMRGGEMLAPGDGSDHVQVIDVRDVARFVRTVIEHDTGGVFNLAGPRFTWARFMQILGARDLVWVPAAILREAGLTFVELPLFRTERGPLSGLMDVSNERARGAGLTLTDPAVTARDVRRSPGGIDVPVGLGPQREAELIRRAKAS
jgi:2'-hydroxyisoflavone reductase